MSQTKPSQTASAPQDAAAAVAALEAENADLRRLLQERAAQGPTPPDWTPEMWRAVGYSPEEWRRNHPENAPAAIEHAQLPVTALAQEPEGEQSPPAPPAG